MDRMDGFAVSTTTMLLLALTSFLFFLSPRWLCHLSIRFKSVSVFTGEQARMGTCQIASNRVLCLLQTFHTLWQLLWAYIRRWIWHLHFQLRVVQSQFLQQPWLDLQPTERVQPLQHLRPNIPGRNKQFHTRRSRNFLRNNLKCSELHQLWHFAAIVFLYCA